jgi:phenylacetate-CoA ligase
MSRWLDAVYSWLPLPLQNLAVSAYGYGWRRRRFRGKFAVYRAEFRQREWFTTAEWSAWQTERLRAVLRSAWDAPFYRRAWSASGLSRGDLERFALDNLPRLPLVEKDQIRMAPAAFCPAGRPPPGASRWHTSGSTGTPLSVYLSADDDRRAIALRDARYETSAGVTYALPRATISGRHVEPDPNSRGPFHRYNRVERQVYLSAYHLGERTIAQYVEALWTHEPQWLTGYASAIHDLARLSLEAGLRCPPLRAVVTVAEGASPELRESVRRAFGCRVVEEYGMVEQVCFALECPSGSLHVSPDAGIVEIVDEGGRVCRPGAIGEVVSTGFLVESQLFVRYRTGDLASWSERACACGRFTPVLRNIEGRVGDVVIGAHGRRVGRLTSALNGLPGVAMAQFVQPCPGALRVRVVPDGVLTEGVRDEICRRLRQRLGSEMRIEVEQVASLQRTPRGKVRSVISELTAAEKGGDSASGAA